jgi:hypothetical protein
MQRWWDLFVEPWGLREPGLDRALNGCGVAIRCREAAVIQLAAVLARWATPGLRAFVGSI